MIYKLRSELDFVAIDDQEGVVMHPKTLSTFAFNETGVWLYKRAEHHDGIMDVTSLSEELCHEFDVSLERALKDVKAFCQTLADRGLATLISNEDK